MKKAFWLLAAGAVLSAIMAATLSRAADDTVKPEAVGVVR